MPEDILSLSKSGEELEDNSVSPAVQKALKKIDEGALDWKWHWRGGANVKTLMWYSSLVFAAGMVVLAVRSGKAFLEPGEKGADLLFDFGWQFLGSMNALLAGYVSWAVNSATNLKYYVEFVYEMYDLCNEFFVKRSIGLKTFLACATAQIIGFLIWSAFSAYPFAMLEDYKGATDPLPHEAEIGVDFTLLHIMGVRDLYHVVVNYLFCEALPKLRSSSKNYKGSVFGLIAYQFWQLLIEIAHYATLGCYNPSSEVYQQWEEDRLGERINLQAAKATGNPILAQGQSVAELTGYLQGIDIPRKNVYKHIHWEHSRLRSLSVNGMRFFLSGCMFFALLGYYAVKCVHSAGKIFHISRIAVKWTVGTILMLPLYSLVTNGAISVAYRAFTGVESVIAYWATRFKERGLLLEEKTAKPLTWSDVGGGVVRYSLLAAFTYMAYLSASVALQLLHMAVKLEIIPASLGGLIPQILCIIGTVFFNIIGFQTMMDLVPYFISVVTLQPEERALHAKAVQTHSLFKHNPDGLEFSAVGKSVQYQDEEFDENEHRPLLDNQDETKNNQNRLGFCCC